MMSHDPDLPFDEFFRRYVKPAAEDLMRRVMAGEPISSVEEKLIRSLGPESESWALNVELDSKK